MCNFVKFRSLPVFPDRMDPAKFTIKEGIEKPGFVMTKLWETTAQDTVRFYNNKGDLVDLKNESRYTEVESFFKFQSTRVRWFFVSIASCDPGPRRCSAQYGRPNSEQPSFLGHNDIGGGEEVGNSHPGRIQ